MKRRSMIVTGIVLLCLVNLVWNFIDLTHQIRDFRQQMHERVARDVAEQFDQLLAKATAEDLAKALQESQDRGKISFFIVKGDRAPASSSLPERVSPDFPAMSDGFVRFALDPGSRHPQAAYVGQVIDGREIIIGKLIPQNYISAAIEQNRVYFWRNFLVQVLIIIAVIPFSFRELIVLLRRVQWGGGSLALPEGEVPAFSFHETESIATALVRSSSRQKHESERLERLRGEVAPSLLLELQANEEPPYEFEAVMVRVDINESTRVYSTPELHEVQHHWFDYFKVHCAESASRYEGVIHEENGDEVIVYFKVPPNSSGALSGVSCAAVSCLRDIFAVADEVDRQLQGRLDFRFRIKAAADVGRLRVFRSSFEFDGGGRRLKIEGASGETRNPFLTTVRMLKFVEDKAVNSAILTGRVLEGAGVLVSRPLALKKSVPGIEDRESYHAASDFHDPEGVEPGLRHFFRSDRDLEQRLALLGEAQVGLDERERVLAQLCALRRGSFGPSVQRAYLEALSKALESDRPEGIKGAPVASEAVRRSHRFVATLVTLAPKFIREASLIKELIASLTLCLSHVDDRVQANAIEAWGELDLQLTQLQKGMTAFRHNRSLANALVVALKKGLEPKLMKALTHMLSDQDPFMRAAGCYALGELFRHYRVADPVLVESNPVLRRQLDLARALAEGAEPMVRRQAQRALKKFAA